MFHNNFFLAALVSVLFPLFCHSQNEPSQRTPPPALQAATPAHMWEFGLHGGMVLGWADVDYMPGWGTGFHARRAIDYVFSLRGEVFLSKIAFEDNNDGSSQTTWQSANIQLLISLNNLVWSANSNRKVNVFALAGGGLNRFKVDVTKAISPQIAPLDFAFQSNGDLGIGLSFRLSSRVNIGLESKASFLFGNHADRLDGVDRQDSDLLSYSSLRLNINLGNDEKKAEPLYWVNPMENILRDISELKERPSFDLTDTDGDGVIDLIDLDNATPDGVPVDTRGIPLDSDGDGIPNHEDLEPYLMEGGRPLTTEEDIERIVEEKLRNRKEKEDEAINGLSVDIEMVNAFLPIIHFGVDSYKIRYADYGHLASIAKLMKNTPTLRIVVTGFTDKTASPDYNNQLSFRRADAAIEHLTNVHSIERNRFILNYSGEDAPLVPSTGSNLMNRRVEFRVATVADMESRKP